jgi:Protein of unknown function (DUF3617)
MRSNSRKQWIGLGMTLALFVASGVAQQKTQDQKLPTKTIAQANPQGKKWQPLNVKAGLWESTRTWTTSGQMPIPEGMLDRLTPEQRARFEERMKANSSAKTHTTDDKHCVTKEDLQKPPKFTDSADCTWTLLESSDTRAKGSAICQVEGMKMTGNGEFQAPDQEHMTATIHLTSTGGGHSMTTDATIASKWLGSGCGSVN